MILVFGVAISLASGSMFNYHLIQLNGYLKEHHQGLWKKFGSGNKNLHFLAKLHRVRSLATEYTADDEILDQKLRVLSLLNWGVGLGCAVILAGVLMLVLSSNA